MDLKRTLKRVAPKSAVAAYQRARSTFSERRLARHSLAETFNTIYAERAWGTGGESDLLTSGSGSHRNEITDPYVAEINNRIAHLSRNRTLTIVDLGCGDFNVGSQLVRPDCQFIACDVATSVVEQNRLRFAGLDVVFTELDLVTDPLPSGDVALLRQVLQHLSNRHIMQILPKLAEYDVVFITEHHPHDMDLIARNRDKLSGSATRVINGSGVFLDDAPFNLPSDSLRLLLELEAPPLIAGQRPGRIRTYEYLPHKGAPQDGQSNHPATHVTQPTRHAAGDVNGYVQ